MMKYSNTQTKSHRTTMCALFGALLLTAVLHAGDNQPAPPKLQISKDKLSLQWAGRELLADGIPRVIAATFESRAVKEKNNFYTYTHAKARVDNARLSVDPAERSITQSYDWGALTVRYEERDGCLFMHVAASNTGKQPISNFRIQLAEIRLPKRLPLPERTEANLDDLKRREEAIKEGIKTGGKDAARKARAALKALERAKERAKRSRSRGNPWFSDTLDNPAAYGLPLGDNTVYACYESFAPPIKFGVDIPKTGTVYPLILAGGVRAFPRDGIMVPPQGIPRIPPGETLKLTFSLRFAGPHTPRNEALRPFYSSFQRFQSPMLDWPDRRPLGACYTLGEWGKVGPKFGLEGTNPRRWFSPSLDTVDVFSPHGKGMIRRHMVGAAHQAVRCLKQMDAQGMIMWNLEGAFHSTGFVGDPRMLPILSPELADAMDDYFRIIREAGFTVGACIRHPQMRWEPKRGRWNQGIGNINPSSDPLLDGYDDLVPDYTPWWTVYPIARRLSAKIDYAKKRWGCKIFYYDTSTVMRFYGEGGKHNFTSAPEAHIYRKIREDHPDVLIVPEIVPRDSAASLAHVAPYGQTGYGRVRPMIGKDYTRDLVPHYFGVHYIHDSGGDPWKDRTFRINEICWGEILIADGWWGFFNIQHSIKRFYEQAGAHLRRTRAFMQRFKKIERPEEVLPFPYVMEAGRALNGADLVLNPPGNPQLRPVTASSKNKREALLLLAWYGWPFPPGTELRPDLPGVDIDGEHLRVWDVETGDLINSSKSVVVEAAPATMMRALYIRAADSPPPAPRPDGVRFGVSFDNGLQPDLGGGLLTNHGAAKTKDKALLLQPNGGAAEYGVVPSWFSGTLEFDIEIDQLGDKPTTLVQFRHHMDTKLLLTKAKGKPVLQLQTMEREATKDNWKSTDLSPEKHEGPKLRQTQAPLTAGRKQRIVLSWEMGQYQIFVDGKRTAVLSAPAILRYRDATLFKPGLIFGCAGNGGGTGTVHLDSALLYDWAFHSADAKNRTPKSGFRPASKPANPKPSVWLWGGIPAEKKKQVVAVNFRPCPNGDRTMRLNTTLYEKTDAGLRRLSQGTTIPYRGVANVLFKYEPEAPKDVKVDMNPGEDADLEGMDELLKGNKVFVLKISAGGKANDPRERTIEFSFSDRDVENW